MSDVEAAARAANAPDLWAAIWRDPSKRDWRAEALLQVYGRIDATLPDFCNVVDLGGGVGALASMLTLGEQRLVHVWDLSEEALRQAEEKGAQGTKRVDFEDWPTTCGPLWPDAEPGPRYVVSTELLEHLSEAARHALVQWSHDVDTELALFSVPNYRLGPPGSGVPGVEEPQHTIAYTAVTLRAELELVWEHARVWALGPYLLALCTREPIKPFRLSVTLPVRDEEAEIEAVLASFRGVADEIVIGIDPRTIDGTREIVERYADLVFDLRDPAAQLPETRAWLRRQDPKNSPDLPPEGVHFAWIRNQCLALCTGDWVFMTEGHERLDTSGDAESWLLNLHKVRTPDGLVPDVITVKRQGNRQQWAFPWLHRRNALLRYYVRRTHNSLHFPDNDVVIKTPLIVTLHDRDHSNALARHEQRGTQNRESLLDDWERAGNANSLFYLGQELRGNDPEAGQQYLELYLEQETGNGLACYQARLMLAKIYARQFRPLRARQRRGDVSITETEIRDATALEQRAHDCLILATTDDWTRTEHWLWLGDLAFWQDQLEQALMFYRYAASLVGEPPFGPWWVDLDMYSWLPAQRMALVHSHMGNGPEAAHWCQRVLDTLPPEAEDWCREEASANKRQIEDAMAEQEAGRTMHGLEAQQVLVTTDDDRETTP